MSPDILPGLAAGASAPPIQTGPAATGPPGDAGLSALFASLLTQSGGARAKAGVIPGLQPDSLAAKTNPGEAPGRQTAPASLSPFTLPIKAASAKTAELDPTKPGPMKPLLPPTAGVTAETQNAMDTTPVSGPRKAKASETKPGGELPLLEARTTPSSASPAPPVLFIAISPVPAVAPPNLVKLSEPVAASQALAGLAPVAVALPVPVAAPSVVPPLPVQVQPVAAGTPSGVPNAVLTAVVAGQAPTTPPALAKAWTLPATPMPERPLPPADPKPAAVTAGPILETAAAPALPPAKPTAVMPYVVTGQTLIVPAQAVTVAAAESAPVAKGPETPTTVGPRPGSGRASAALLLAPNAANSVAKAPEGLNAPRPTMSVPDPTQGIKTAAVPQAVVMAAVPVPQSQPVGVDVPPADKGNADSGVSATSSPQAPMTKISLRSLTPSADNNTRTQTAATSRPGPLTLKAVGVSETTERPVTKVGDGGQEMQEAAAPVPAQAPAPTVSAAPMPLTRTDRAEVVRQVAEAVGAMPPPPRPGTASQMTLQLHPRDWGQLQISVRITPTAQSGVTQAQTVTAHVVAASPQIKAVLESGSGDLRHALRQAGLHLDKLTVTVQAPEGAAKSGMMSGGHHLRDGGNGGQSQPDGRPAGNGPQAGGASFASWTGSPQGGREGGQQAPPQTGAHETGESTEEPISERDAPRRAVSGQVDMRA